MTRGREGIECVEPIDRIAFSGNVTGILGASSNDLAVLSPVDHSN